MFRTASVTALAATLALAGAGTALADTGHGELPAGAKVLGAPKLLSVKAAAKARTRMEAGKPVPRAPRLAVKTARLERTPAPAPLTGPKPAPGARMFGNEAGYSVKRDRILGAIQTFNATMIPQFGGRYVPPALYELQHGGAMCGGAVYNGMYCPSSNAIGWSMAWTAAPSRTRATRCGPRCSRTSTATRRSGSSASAAAGCSTRSTPRASRTAWRARSSGTPPTTACSTTSAAATGTSSATPSSPSSRR